MTRTDIAATETIETLDSFYCYNVTAALWADAVINRLEGLAIFLLGDELAEVADRARAAARRLADRVRGTDDLSFHLVLDLLAAETHQRADLQAALAQHS